MNDQIKSMNTHTLLALIDNPETGALIQELSEDEKSKLRIDTRDYAEGGDHIVYIAGEPFFSFELWLGRIQNVRRLREKRPPPEPERTKWEYTSGWASDDRLNELGSEGWELVSVVFANDETTMYFKREKK